MAGTFRSWQTAGWQAAAIFVLLSVSAECLQCYWCGPRAEQVHRSQRAPPCGDGTYEVAACELGHTHCAVVATSPPYAESRHCVKFYQDECYAQYCNTSKSFRMTCPCRGDLCNGPNTERETQAFATLAEIVANARIKRSAITTSGEGKAMMNNLVENDDSGNAESNNDVQTDTPAADPVENTHESSAAGDSKVSTTPVSHTDPVKTEDSTTEAVEEMPVAMEVVSTAESPKLETAESLKLESTKMPEPLVTPAEDIKAEMNEMVSNEIKPSMQLPTAEALQQNASPIVTTEKTMDQTTPPPTPITTVENDSGSPMPTESKNASVVASLSSFILLSSFAFKVFTLGNAKTV